MCVCVYLYAMIIQPMKQAMNRIMAVCKNWLSEKRKRNKKKTKQTGNKVTCQKKKKTIYNQSSICIMSLFL